MRANSWRGVVVALLALGSSVWLLLPRRNVFGNPAYEELIDECPVPGTTDLVRLYKATGRRTVQDWYSVTYRRRGLHVERQFLYTYGSPIIEALQCAETTVLVVGLGQEIDYERVREELIATPIGWYQDEPRRTPARPARVLRIALGAGLIGTAALLLWQVRKEP